MGSFPYKKSIKGTPCTGSDNQPTSRKFRLQPTVTLCLLSSAFIFRIFDRAHMPGVSGLNITNVPITSPWVVANGVSSSIHESISFNFSFVSFLFFLFLLYTMFLASNYDDEDWEDIAPQPLSRLFSATLIYFQLETMKFIFSSPFPTCFGF